MLVQLKAAFMGKPAGERIDIGDEHGSMLIKQGVAEAIQGDPLNAMIASTMEKAMTNLSNGVNLAITQAVQKVQEAQQLSRKNGVQRIFGEGGEGDTKKNFGDWLCGVARNDRGYLEKHYGTHFVEYTAKAAMGEGQGATGGYIVPPEFYRDLIAIVSEETFFRQRAFVQPMGSATLQIPYLDVSTVQSAGVSPFFGGVQMYWTEEAQTRTETEPQFKQLELRAHELSGYSVSSNILLQDSAFGLEKFLMTLFGRAVGWFEEYAFLQGNGVGKPLGILNSPAAISVTRTSANLVKFADVATMFSKLLPVSQKRAVWAISPYALAQLIQLQDGGGRVVWVPNSGGAQEGVPGKLFGLPVFTTEKLPALGTKGDVMLFDPQLYVIGDRMQIEIANSPHVNFLKNQMTWRVVERVDGQPWLEKAVTLQDGASTVSPFILLN